jgi:hypothetical protein
MFGGLFVPPCVPFAHIRRTLVRTDKYRSDENDMFNHRDRRIKSRPPQRGAGDDAAGPTPTRDARPGLRLRAILRVDVTYSILILCAILEIFLARRYSLLYRCDRHPIAHTRHLGVISAHSQSHRRFCRAGRHL